MCFLDLLNERSWLGFTYQSVHFQGVLSQNQKMAHALTDLMNVSQSVIMVQLRWPLDECRSTAQPEIGIIIRAVRGNDTLQMRRLWFVFTFIIIYIADGCLPNRFTQHFRYLFKGFIHCVKRSNFPSFFQTKVLEVPQNFLFSSKRSLNCKKDLVYMNTFTLR